VIDVYGAEWCGDCRRSKALLSKLGVAFTYIEVDKDEVARERAFVIAGRKSIPVVVFPDGSHLVEPSDGALREALVERGLLLGDAS
jgi:mycoredoxin